MKPARGFLAVALGPQGPHVTNRVLGALATRPGSAAAVDVRTRTLAANRVDHRRSVVDRVELAGQRLAGDPEADLQELGIRRAADNHGEVGPERSVRVKVLESLEMRVHSLRPLKPPFGQRNFARCGTLC